MTDSRPTHEVYIIHLWRAATDNASWRGRIQNVRTGQSQSAPDLDELVDLFQRYFSKEEAETPPTQEKGLK